MTKSVMPKDEVLPQTKIIPVNLPPPDTERWGPRRKATIVNAVHSGVMSPEEVCGRYKVSVEEFVTWQRAIETHGVAGLHVTRTQFIGVLLLLIRRTTPKRRSRLAGF